MTKETWRSIPGCRGRYKVSDLGNVFSLVSGRLLKLSPNASNYRVVNLATSDNKRKPHLVHRLVLRAFVGKCPKGKETRHLNGNPADNRLRNLVYGTPKENTEDKKRHGTFHIGVKHGQSKLTEETVTAIRKQIKTSSYKKLATKYKVSAATVQDAVRNRTWKHVGGGVTESRKYLALTKQTVARLRKKYREDDVSMRQLAEELGVSVGTVCHAIRGKTWGSDQAVTKSIKYRADFSGTKNGASKLNEACVRSIRQKYADRLASQAELAVLYKVSISCISLIIRRKHWAHVS